jgi:hypothetical protein
MRIEGKRSDLKSSGSAASALPQITRLFSRSSQRPYQIHYGASSNISLLNYLYQSFNPLFGGDFLLRRLNNFSESLGHDGAESIETDITSEIPLKAILPADELPYSIATEILEHFLAIHRLLIPVQSPEVLRFDLRAFYDLEHGFELSRIRRRALILVLATASLTTRHHSLADILFSQFNQTTILADDNLTIISIEIDCLLISFAAFLVIPISLTGVSGITLATTPRKGSSIRLIWQ